MKIVLSRSGPFRMTIYLMQLYWEKSMISGNDNQPCFLQTERPDLILDYAIPLHPEMDLTWDGENEQKIYCVTTCELIEFNDCLASRLDKYFIAAVEEAIKDNHSLEVITILEAVLKHEWKILFDEVNNREIVEIINFVA